MRFPEALCVRDALLGSGRSCFLVAICVGNAFGSVETVAGQVLLGGGRSLLVAKGVFWWREVFFLVAGGVFWWRKVFFGGVRSLLVAGESFGSRKSCFLVAICVGSYGSVGRVAKRDVLVAEEALFGGDMRRMGGNTRRGRMCGICRRLRVPGNLWRACVESVGDALFGGNMRRFLWIHTKGGKGGNTRRVHNALVAEEALFGGNMRRNGGRMRRFLWIRTKGGKGGGNTRGAPHGIQVTCL
jgi:hypothetical protein